MPRLLKNKLGFNQSLLGLGSNLPNFFPSTCFGRVQDGFANILGFQRIPEVGSQWAFFAGAISGDKVSKLVNKTMLISDV